MLDLQPELEALQQQGLYRSRHVLQSAQGAVIRIDGRELLSFCSNDYLGLANHAAIKQALVTATERYGVGSGAAHLVNGHSQLHHDCEVLLAEFTGRDRALLFSTGYMANLAIGSALAGRKDVILQDKLNHASLIDAAKLSGAKLIRYRHGDMQQLGQLLQQQQHMPAQRLLMTDGVFSMDGDKADLPRLAELCADNDCALMVDDAHGFGVQGESGAGICEETGLAQQQVPLLMATLGKAVGVSGAFVAGGEAVIETLIQRARSYIYTTASPPALAAAVMQGIRVIQRERWRHDKLFELIDYFKNQVNRRLPCQLMPSDTAIQPIIIGDNHEALRISRALLADGLLVTAIRPPTVPRGTARLRITLSAAHERQHIDRLISSLAGSLPDKWQKKP